MLVEEGIKVFSPPQQDPVLVLQECEAICCFDRVVLGAVDAFYGVVEVVHILFVSIHLYILSLTCPPIILQGLHGLLGFPSSYLPLLPH